MRDSLGSDGVLLTTGQVARVLGISAGRVWELTRSGALSFTPTAIGNVYRPADVNRLAESRRLASAADWRITPPPSGDSEKVEP